MHLRPQERGASERHGATRRVVRRGLLLRGRAPQSVSFGGICFEIRDRGGEVSAAWICAMEAACLVLQSRASAGIRRNEPQPE
jgi:hypothetical protein